MPRITGPTRVAQSSRFRVLGVKVMEFRAGVVSKSLCKVGWVGWIWQVGGSFQVCSELGVKTGVKCAVEEF